MNPLELVENWIKEIINKEDILIHHLKTRDYLLMLDPDVSVEAQIAALTHDIERQMSNKVPTPENETEYDRKYLIDHGKNSANYVTNFLKKNKVKLDFDKLNFLLTNHELGGDDETDLLRDADSLSFLEVVAEHFAKKFSKEFSKHKFRYMFDRIENEKAKELAKPLFEKDMKILLTL